LFAFPLPKLLGLDASWGTAGLTASAGFSGWIEFYLLRKSLNTRIGQTGLKIHYQLMLWVSALIASLVGYSVKQAIHFRPIFSAVVIFSVYGVTYFGVTYLLKVEESKSTIDKVLNKLKKLIKR